MLPEMAPHTYSINSDMRGDQHSRKNRYSNPWFLKHVEPETQTIPVAASDSLGGTSRDVDEDVSAGLGS